MTEELGKQEQGEHEPGEKCLECDSTETKVWTVSSPALIGLIPLCEEHAQPLAYYVARANKTNPILHQRRTARGRRAVERERPRLEALDWTPPPRAEANA